MTSFHTNAGPTSLEEGVYCGAQVHRRVRENRQPQVLEDVLEKKLLPRASQHFENTTRTYQQDSAPAHSAEVVQKWCADNFPDFISAKEWPPNSPDLNPMDYSIWFILKSKACATSHASIDSPEEDLKKAWEGIDEDVLSAAVDAFPKRLRPVFVRKEVISRQ